MRVLGASAALGLVACGTALSREDPAPNRAPVGQAAPIQRAERAAPPSVAPELPAARKPPPAYGSADLDPDNDELVAPPDVIPDCAQRLERAGVSWKPAELPLKQKVGDVYTCGAEQAVVYVRGPEKIRFNGAPILTCGMAIALARFEQLLNEEALRTLKSRVVRIQHIGTYNCRKMTRFRHLVSEHSYGNAIDIQSFTLENGAKISVLSHFGRLDREPTRDSGIFLRSLARRAYDEGVFSVVVTPFFDALHKDHFHFDLARYRVDGTR